MKIVKGKVVLDDDDKRILEMMKRNRPDRKWDAKKYIQMKYGQFLQNKGLE